METIKFNGNEYPVEWVYVPGFGERLIATESLEDELIDAETDEAQTKEAKAIDEQIFFYVEDTAIDRDDLEQIVAAEVCEEEEIVANNFYNWLIDLGYRDPEDKEEDMEEVIEDFSTISTEAPRLYNLFRDICDRG